MFKKKVSAPQSRSTLRKKLGKQFYILKRKIKWLADAKKYTTHRSSNKLPNICITHSSTLLRPLKDVDMQLQRNKITNLKLAIDKIDGLLLAPGERFSFWKLVGAPTKSKGYLPGLVLESGKINSGYGGGLCQMGNLIYWMTLHTPLEVIERYRHSFDVFPDVNRTLPFGSGATLSYNYIDLQIENTSNQTYQLNLWLDEKKLHGSWNTEAAQEHHYQVYESKHEIHNQQWGGYTRHNEIRRKIFDQSDQLLDDELITENHAIMMYNPFLDEG